MAVALEYIVTNYTWFIIGAIVILLAIIGSYADKTNFGQGKENVENNLVSEEKINDNIYELPSNNEIMLESQTENYSDDNESNMEDAKQIEEQILDNQNRELQNLTLNVNKNNTETNFNEKFEKFEKEFNDALPEKEIINNDLLEDINNISLDKKESSIYEIPDLDDIELPRIKKMEKEEDVWKF